MSHNVSGHDRTDTLPFTRLPWPDEPHLAAMPRSVRTAQITTLLFAALGIILAVTGSAAGNLEHAGEIAFTFVPGWIAAIPCLRFSHRGSTTRTTAIVCGTLELLFGLAGTLNQTPPGLLGVLCGLTTIACLTRPSARAWFV
ncbi:hypothetical protein NDR87_27735 [Nocardia sp. CDC159]|uniref:Uncharacterized protein n=1 Tax=Nocardia pulmonis TaxID=2951408 RepID=A0A9X2EAE4_9NOCA|nr:MULTISPECIES: hypothetical protein [Nocardia]MCM6777284.1 hypothetical protein [Nocardia pulmonis]MCM6790169.1 hypothetical protein [Nocardia sp. CDC159]